MTGQIIGWSGVAICAVLASIPYIWIWRMWRDKGKL